MATIEQLKNWTGTKSLRVVRDLRTQGITDKWEMRNCDQCALGQTDSFVVQCYHPARDEQEMVVAFENQDQKDRHVSDTLADPRRHGDWTVEEMRVTPTADECGDLDPHPDCPFLKGFDATLTLAPERDEVRHVLPRDVRPGMMIAGRELRVSSVLVSSHCEVRVVHGEKSSTTYSTNHETIKVIDDLPQIVLNETSAHLAKGIEQMVWWLRSCGFHTTDSGNGDGVIKFPHVICRVSREDMIDESHRIMKLVNEKVGTSSTRVEGAVQVEATYGPADDIAFIMLSNVTDMDLFETPFDWPLRIAARDEEIDGKVIVRNDECDSTTIVTTSPAELERKMTNFQMTEEDKENARAMVADGWSIENDATSSTVEKDEKSREQVDSTKTTTPIKSILTRIMSTLVEYTSKSNYGTQWIHVWMLDVSNLFSTNALAVEAEERIREGRHILARIVKSNTPNDETLATMKKLVADIDEFIGFQDQVVAQFPEATYETVEFLNHMGVLLRERFKDDVDGVQALMKYGDMAMDQSVTKQVLRLATAFDIDLIPIAEKFRADEHGPTVIERVVTIVIEQFVELSSAYRDVRKDDEHVGDIAREIAGILHIDDDYEGDADESGQSRLQGLPAAIREWQDKLVYGLVSIIGPEYASESDGEQLLNLEEMFSLVVEWDESIRSRMGELTDNDDISYIGEGVMRVEKMIATMMEAIDGRNASDKTDEQLLKSFIHKTTGVSLADDEPMDLEFRLSEVATKLADIRTSLKAWENGDIVVVDEESTKLDRLIRDLHLKMTGVLLAEAKPLDHQHAFNLINAKLYDLQGEHESMRREKDEIAHTYRSFHIKIGDQQRALTDQMEHLFLGGTVRWNKFHTMTFSEKVLTLIRRLVSIIKVCQGEVQVETLVKELDSPEVPTTDTREDAEKEVVPHARATDRSVDQFWLKTEIEAELG